MLALACAQPPPPPTPRRRRAQPARLIHAAPSVSSSTPPPTPSASSSTLSTAPSASSSAPSQRWLQAERPRAPTTSYLFHAAAGPRSLSESTRSRSSSTTATSCGGGLAGQTGSDCTLRMEVARSCLAAAAWSTPLVVSFPFFPLFLPLVHGHRLAALESDDRRAPSHRPQGRLLSSRRCLPLPSGPWAGPRGFTSRAYQAGPAQKIAQQAVPGPSARHEAQLGTAREARRAVPARLHQAVPGTGPCRALSGQPVGHLWASCFPFYR